MSYFLRGMGFGVGGLTGSEVVFGIMFPMIAELLFVLIKCLLLDVVTNPSMIIPSLHMIGIDGIDGIDGFDGLDGFAIF